MSRSRRDLRFRGVRTRPRQPSLLRLGTRTRTSPPTSTRTACRRRISSEVPPATRSRQPACPTSSPRARSHAWRFQYGDFIPLSWTFEQQAVAPQSARAAVERRRPRDDPEAFANATYLQDNRVGGRRLPAPQGSHRRSRSFRPARRRSAPALVSFRNWYKGCTSSTDACNGVDRLGRLRGVERLLLGLPAQVRPRPHRRRRDLRRRLPAP